MSDQVIPGPAFRLFAKAIVFVALLLVWWGAATTTKQAGMIFADWPLSMGSVNPPGWLENMIPFLEHTHRLLAKLVGTLVLALFCWSYVRSGRQALEVFAVVFVLAVALGFFIAAGAERVDAARKGILMAIGLVVFALPVAWLVWSWSRRGWSLVQKLSALALLMVVTQAILGGLRVTEISDAFAVVHGCFAQAFFCVLILIVLVSAPGWGTNGYSDRPHRLVSAKRIGIGLTALVGWQLVLGAKMRHFHRAGLVDDDLLKTAGEWIPEFSNPIIAVLFLHKVSAFAIFFFVLGLILWVAGGRKETPDRRAWHMSLTIGGLVAFQIVLGLTVIATGKSFWVTNVHVLNGLAILALSFVFAVRSWTGNAAEPALARGAS